MSEMPSIIAQQEYVGEMAESLRALLTQRDSCILYVANWMWPYSQSKCWAVRPDGQFNCAEGSANSISSPRGNFNLVEARLRKACYQDGKGTWFGLKLSVAADGEVTARYNYDSEPAWTRPIEPTLYVQEQEKYPRDLEHQPEWFKRRLAEGRVALEEWRRAQGR
jgi:hypothetical protein